MPLLSYDPMADGNTASANLWNVRLSKIHDLLNGNLDAANLADGAVTTPKIADGAVTNSKLALVSQFDNSGSYIKFGNFCIQYGTTLVSNSGTNIVFAVPFTSTPGVVCTETDPNSQSPWVTVRSTTGFTCKQPYTAAQLYISWIAIGSI